MILDKFNQLGSTSSITSASTYALPDVIDLQSSTSYVATASGGLYTVGQGTQNRDLGSGGDLYVYFSVTTAFAGGTNATFQVVVSNSSTLASGNIVVGETGPIVNGSLGKGAQVAVRINPQLLGSTGLQYLGAQVVTTGTNTDGVVRGDVVMDIQDGKRAYASGFTVA